ncbi:hypothetical protein [Extensimonas vulgaris]|nr:hypothetical protein [Extensimonas vulgaris]MBC7215673.1 hypothetical protein [Burkholderiaceae bacterium]TXD16822.1 hypothetical protein FUT63_02190 [Extensimonas vulgaris]
MAVRHDTGALPAGGFYFAPGAIEHMPRRARRTAGQMVPMRRTTAVLLAVLCIELGALLLLAAGKAWH